MSANTNQLNYTLRAMRAEDVVQAHQLTQKLCWPHRQEDWLTMVHLATAMVIEYDGKLIGTACAVVQGEYTSLGLVVIADDYQGHGLGRELVTAVMEASQSSSFFLSATAAGTPLYTKLGFQEYARIHQYQGQVTQSACAHRDESSSYRIRRLTESDAPQMIALLNRASGMDRSHVFAEVQKNTEYSVGLEKEGKLIGFASYRRFGRGEAIGPVIANDTSEAKALLRYLLAENVGKFVRVDTPERYQLGHELNEWGLSQVDDISAMYLGQKPSPSSSLQTYCLITQALG